MDPLQFSEGMAEVQQDITWAILTWEVYLELWPTEGVAEILNRRIWFFKPLLRALLDSTVTSLGKVLDKDRRAWSLTNLLIHAEKDQSTLAPCLDVAQITSLSPNPPKDTDGRREDSGRGVRELRGRWPGLPWGGREVGGGSSVVAPGPYGRLRTLGRARSRGEDAAGNHPGPGWRGRWVGRLMGQWRTDGVRPGVESLAAGLGRG